nr:helix-turn-helix domain-containing protein [Nonomuraea sp. FMUSA5-5]
MELFWTRGYEATTVRDLTRHLGLGQGSLYAAFGDKDGLYRAALEHYRSTLAADALRRLEEGADARSAIRAMLAARRGTTRTRSPRSWSPFSTACWCPPRSRRTPVPSNHSWRWRSPPSRVFFMPQICIKRSTIRSTRVRPRRNPRPHQPRRRQRHEPARPHGRLRAGGGAAARRAEDRLPLAPPRPEADAALHRHRPRPARARRLRAARGRIRLRDDERRHRRVDERARPRALRRDRRGLGSGDPLPARRPAPRARHRPRVRRGAVPRVRRGGSWTSPCWRSAVRRSSASATSHRCGS